MPISAGAAVDTTSRGTIDEIRVYNIALTAAQIQTDMNTPVGVVDTQAPTAPSGLSQCRQQRPDQSELDRLDRQRRGDRLSGRAVPGSRVHDICAGRDNQRDHDHL